MKLILCVLLVLGSCSFKKKNQLLQGHEELYSEPEEPKLESLDDDERRVVIASTNDLHGKYDGETVTFSDQHNKGKQTINIGGREVISGYFQILRDVYKNVLLVDSGDIFSKASKAKAVSDFYSTNKYDAVTVGLRDFNLKVPAKVGSNTNLFQNFAKSSKVPLLLSNLYELKTARVVEWEGTKSHVIKNVDGVKVGIMGLIPDDIVAQTPVNNRVGLYVENMLQSTLRHARLLRSLGADIVVVLTHQGIDCGSSLAEKSKLPLMKVNFEPELENVCDLNNLLGEYLNRLPPKLVDVVIGGRTHQKMANYVNGTLVMGSYPNGKSFSFTEFVVNIKTKRIEPEKTIVHQPVFFCTEFFNESNDCFTEDKTIDHKKRIPATFLGKEVPKTIGPQQLTEVNAPDKRSIVKDLGTFNGDLSYVHESSGETQLFVINLPGRELVKILEEDYNRGRKDHWWPSPFLLKGNDLTVSIVGEKLDLNKTYRVLSDLESVQKHPRLVKKVTAHHSEALMNHSWSLMEEDSVRSQLAAQSR